MHGRGFLHVAGLVAGLRALALNRVALALNRVAIARRSVSRSVIARTPIWGSKCVVSTF